MSLDTVHISFTVENEQGFFTANGHLKVRTRGWWRFKRKKLRGYASVLSRGKPQQTTGTGPNGVSMTMTFNGAPERMASWHHGWTRIADERTALLEALEAMTRKAIDSADAGRFFDHSELYGHAMCSLLLGGGETPDALDGMEFFRYMETGETHRKV